METPGFQETKLKKLGSTHYTTPRVVFDRKEALEKAPEHLKEVFQNLFDQIDYIELVINYYDLENGKRKNPPRESLVSRFNEEKRQRCMQRARELSQRQYLQMRHYLVELRTEQYTYRYCVETAVMPHPEATAREETQIRFGEDIEVLPMGLYTDSSLSKKIFRQELDPFIFTEEDLEKISDWLWKKRDPEKCLNFEDPLHILALYRTYGEIESEATEDKDQIYNASNGIFKTLNFYEEGARLNDLQREILHMKIQQRSNADIADYINKKYGMTYNDNYISTIYRHKILQSVADAATFHREVMENIFYPENFKKCKDCGKFYLRTPDFFMRQHKAPDGFSPRCKACQKIKREEGKMKYEYKYAVS